MTPAPPNPAPVLVLIGSNKPRPAAAYGQEMPPAWRTLTLTCQAPTPGRATARWILGASPDRLLARPSNERPLENLLPRFKQQQLRDCVGHDTSAPHAPAALVVNTDPSWSAALTAADPTDRLHTADPATGWSWMSVVLQALGDLIEPPPGEDTVPINVLKDRLNVRATKQRPIVVNSGPGVSPVGMIAELVALAAFLAAEGVPVRSEDCAAVDRFEATTQPWPSPIRGMFLPWPPVLQRAIDRARLQAVAERAPSAPSASRKM